MQKHMKSQKKTSSNQSSYCFLSKGSETIKKKSNILCTTAQSENDK